MTTSQILSYELSESIATITMDDGHAHDRRTGRDQDLFANGDTVPGCFAGMPRVCRG